MHLRLIIATAIILTAATLSQSKLATTKARPTLTIKPPANQQQLDKQIFTVCHRNIVEDYKKLSKRNPTWDSEAIIFLEAFSKRLAESYNGNKPMYDLAVQARTITNNGCDDPTVMLAYAICTNDCNSLASAIENLSKSKYRKFLAAVAYHYSNIHTKGFNDRVRCILDSFEDGSYLPGEERVALLDTPTKGNDTFGGCFNDEYISDILDMLPKRAKTNAYIKNVLMAKCHIMLAWQARGLGFANEVTDEEWLGFFKEMKTARKLLLEAYKSYPKYPEACDYMIEIASVGCPGEKETARKWLDRAVAAQSDYWPAYNTFMWFNLPRWGGSIETIYKLGEECLNKGTFDNGVPWVYMIALNGYINNNFDGDPSYWRKPKTIACLRKLFDGYKNGGGPYDASWYAAAGIYAFTKAGQYKDVREILLNKDRKIDLKAFRQFSSVDLEDVRAQYIAFGGPLGKQLCQAEALADKGECAKALDMYKEISKVPCNDEPTKTYINNRIPRLEIGIALNKGEWADLVFPSDLHGWKTNGGKWSVLDDATISGSPNNGFEIFYKEPFGFDYEVDVDIEFTDTSEKPSRAGIIFQPSRYEEYGPLYVYCSKSENKVAVMDTFLKELWATDIHVGTHNILRVKKRGDIISVGLNDMPFCSEIKADMGGYEPANLGIGFRSSDSGVPNVTFKNLRMRLIPKDG
ncbi:MAG: hypothetical protein ABFD49_06840 [Armatimonadota bacterium]|nr:DUF1080 domain-containing protein [bacterium]